MPLVKALTTTVIGLFLAGAAQATDVKLNLDVVQKQCIAEAMEKTKGLRDLITRKQAEGADAATLLKLQSALDSKVDTFSAICVQTESDITYIRRQ